MPAETLHHNAQPSARPEGVGADPYNPFHSPEADLKAAGFEIDPNPALPDEALENTPAAATDPLDAFEAQPLDVTDNADKQPRRIRQVNGVTEQLIKERVGDKDEFRWEAIGGTPEQVEATTETHTKVLEEVTAELDRQKEENARLAAELEDLKRRFTTLENSRTAGSVMPEPLAAEIQPTKPEDEEFLLPAESIDEVLQEAEKSPIDEEPKQELEEQPKELKALEALPPKEEEKEEEAEGEPDLELQISKELQEALSSAQDVYAEATAKHRNGFLGHVLHNSKFLTKIPFLQKLADKFNTAQDKVLLGPARDQYKKALLDIQNEIRNQTFAEVGPTPEAIESIRMNAADVAIQSEVDLEMKIAAARMERSGNTNKFINWWVRQDSLGGKLLKAGVVAGVGLTAGLVVGLAGAPIIVGTALGAGAGAGIGVYASKKRASGIVEKGGTYTLAEKQAQEDASLKSQYVAEQKASGDGFANVADLVGITEDRTGNEKVGNRARVKAAAAAGGIGGSAGAAAGSAIRGAVEGAFGQEPAKQAPDVKPDPETPPAEAQPPAAPELQGTSFDVQSGSGYTQELMEFAQANNHALSPDQSFQLHQDLMTQFGGDYIDINGAGNDIYVDAGDVRLMEPGSANWGEGVGPFIQQWMATRGLW